MATTRLDNTFVPVEVVSNCQSNSRPRIRRVPCILRGIEKNKRCYEPIVVSIGPFHHGKPEFQFLEQLKIELEQQFISDMGCDLFPNFDEVAMRAKDCYDWRTLTELPNDVFKRMMFRDGCFILHFIHCMVENRAIGTKMKTDQRVFVLRDLFLLENQLPFIVLKELMSLKFGEIKSKELIANFIRNQTVMPSNPQSQQDSTQPLHLLDLLQKELIRATRDGGDTTAMELDDWYSFRAITELRESGIECKRSNSCSLKDISFKSGIIKGYLLLPPIVIDDSTQTKLLNMVAYETCPDTPDDFTVTSYICFLDSLIDSAEDVKELRSKRILLNVLGSDQQVADLFNDLTIDLVPHPELYRSVKSGIEKHYRSYLRIWMVNLCKIYFGNPWSVIAFVAAAMALLLTTVQTYYTIFPRK
ncbi:UPF0481 protein At3g47200-like [Macadamia integrifolia]|uniref:UPF0481 protein At3g47200-like n=1 Tax=Macadamia integrifolia TaxID=60698 RepID=UPI001C4F3873|nr:UPF0481 protein At3g47200-like [Macadamia integrifolia]